MHHLMLDFKKKVVKLLQPWDYIFHVNPVIYTSLKLMCNDQTGHCDPYILAWMSG